MELDAETIYYMAWREVLRDGRSAEDERMTMERIQKALKLSEESASEIFRRARGDHEGESPDPEPLEPRKLFEHVCQVAWLDGVVELGEATRLTDLAEALELDMDEASDIFDGCQPEGD